MQGLRESLLLLQGTRVRYIDHFGEERDGLVCLSARNVAQQKSIAGAGAVDIRLGYRPCRRTTESS